MKEIHAKEAEEVKRKCGLTNRVKLRIQKRDKFVCRYCDKDGLESLENWHHTCVDHFNSQLFGPKRNNEDNLITSCHYCNAIKGKKIFPNIQEARDYIRERREELYKEYLKIKKDVQSTLSRRC